jgi:hypothetical protein
MQTPQGLDATHGNELFPVKAGVQQKTAIGQHRDAI